MAERLTYWNDKKKKSALPKCINDFGDVVDLEDLCYKLACLEDILEKYGIESVEELGYLLEVFKKMRKQYGKLNQENCKNKRDRDTWKRACELACDVLRDINYKIYNEDRIDFENTFYQQAKNKDSEEC